jgi:ABC-type transport system substrate-binding protein
VRGGTFVYADDADLRSLDPAIAYDEVSWTAMHLVFDTLLDYDEQVRLRPHLAARWEVDEGGALWTFHLRDDVRFHNGRPLVADDVLYSWNRLLDPSLGSPGADFYGAIEGADAVLRGEASTARGLQAPDPHTVVVRLSEPDPAFGNVVAMLFGAPVPREEVEARGEAWRTAPVGTGPFAVESWDLGVRTVFRARDDHWEPGLPYLDAVVHLAGYSRALQFLKLEAGELHEVSRLTSPDYLWIRQTPAWEAQLVQSPSVDTYAELMNTELPPFDDLWFRRAVSTAIDRDKLARIRNQRVFPTVSWIPPALPGHEAWDALDAEGRAAYRYQRFDPALSRECLEKSAWARGPRAPVSYLAINDESSLMTAQSIQQDLAEVGIPMDIRNTTFPAYLSATGRRGTVQMAYTAWVMDYPDTRNFLETRFSCASRADENSVNDSFFCDPEVDALLARARIEADPAARADLYRQAQRIVALAAPYAVTYHSSSVSVTQPFVRGFRVHPVWTRDMREAWLDLPADPPEGAP